MRLMIAGWHGQIARALVELATARADITALSIGKQALELCRTSTIRSTMVEAEPDVMINAAAYTAVDRAETEEDAVFRLNSTGAADFAAVAAKKGVPVIHLSTGYVFDGNKPEPYTEEDAPAPGSVYGRSKLDGERAVTKANPQHIILRTAWIHSPYGRNFVTNILDLARTRDEIDVVDDQIGSPTSALDLAAAILDISGQIAGSSGKAEWGIYHAAGNGGASWCDVARHVLEVSGRADGPSANVWAISSDDYPTSAPRLANARLDCSKLANAFGIALPDWRASVEDCVKRVLSDGAGLTERRDTA